MDQVGLFLGAVLLLTALAHGAGGSLSDRLGRRPVMLLSIWARALSLAGLAAAIAWDASVLVICIFHTAAAFLGSFYGPAARSWIADRIAPSERPRVYGLLRIAFNLGWALGPAAGGFLAASSYALAFSVTAGTVGAAALVLSATVFDSKRFKADARAGLGGFLTAARDRRFLSFCLLTAVVGVVHGHLVVPLSVHAVQNVGLSESQIGSLFSLNGLLVVTTQAMLTNKLSAFRISTSLAGGCFLYAAGYLMVGGASGFSSLAAAVVVFTAGEMAFMPGLMALAVNMAPEGMTGRYAGLNGSLFQVGIACGPAVGGTVLEHSTQQTAPMLWAMVSAMAMAAGAGFFRMRSRFTLEEEGVAAAAA